MSEVMGSDGGGGATTGGAAGLAGCWTGATWAFGLGFELHAVARKTMTAATGHHVRVVILGAPLQDLPDLREPNCKPGAPKRSPPAPPSGGSGPAFVTHAASARESPGGSAAAPRQALPL